MKTFLHFTKYSLPRPSSSRGRVSLYQYDFTLIPKTCFTPISLSTFNGPQVCFSTLLRQDWGKSRLFQEHFRKLSLCCPHFHHSLALNRKIILQSHCIHKVDPVPCKFNPLPDQNSLSFIPAHYREECL